MIIRRSHAESGVALMMTMICVIVLGGMAALFAISMKTETKLAMNANAEQQFYALGQSAVDYCKAVLSAGMACPEEPFDALTQVWAGGSGSQCSNEMLSVIKSEVNLGYGSFKWKMTDLERKANINLADQPMLEQTMRLVGIDAGESGTVVAAIQDWIDRDQSPHINGTETDYYESLDPPYKCKDGYMDDIQELKLIRGVTEEMYGYEGYRPPPPPPSLREKLQLGFDEPPVQRAALKDLFTTISAGTININTASPEVLQLVPFIDENIAQRIVSCREGQDTGQAMPFRNPGEALLCAGVNQEVVGQIQRYFAVRSKTFQADIEVQIGTVKRYYTAVLARNSARDIQVLTFSWKQNPPASHADAR